MNKKKAIGFAVGIALVGAVWAAHHGTWNCGICTLNGATPDPDTKTFIESTVSEKVNAWKAKDTVTICNATTCATYLMASVFGGISGMQQVAKYPREAGGGGGNEGGGGDYGDGGGCVASCGGGAGGAGGGTVIVGDPDPLPPKQEV